ncbi:MAG: DUF4232 domain-containing protein [Actinomycetota bacterium]|nr:DUF4232 domain-containing protein [Actinomycetota bacterium]
MPWLDQAAQLPPPPKPPPPPPVKSSPCRADQLTATAGRTGVAAGNIGSEVIFQNSSASTCSLSGYPTSMMGIRADGSRHTLAPVHGTQFDQESSLPVDLAPGQRTRLTIATGDACDALAARGHGPGEPYTGAMLGLPGGGTVSLTESFNAGCGLGVTTYGNSGPAQPVPVSAYPGLQASLDLPASVAAGSTLRYVVTLTNGGRSVLALDPCPAYEEFYYTNASGHRLVLRLNCLTVTRLRPGQRVRYAMQMPIPDGYGEIKFGWALPAAAIAVGTIHLVITRAAPSR